MQSKTTPDDQQLHAWSNNTPYLDPTHGPSLPAVVDPGQATPNQPDPQQLHFLQQAADTFVFGQPPIQQTGLSDPGLSPAALWRRPEAAVFDTFPDPYKTPNLMFPSSGPNVGAVDVPASYHSFDSFNDENWGDYHDATLNPSSVGFAFVPPERLDAAILGASLNRTNQAFFDHALEYHDSGPVQLPSHPSTSEYMIVNQNYTGPSTNHFPQQHGIAVTSDAVSPGPEIAPHTNDLTQMGSHLPLCECCHQPHFLRGDGLSLQPLHANAAHLLQSQELVPERSRKRRKTNPSPPFISKTPATSEGSSQGGCIKCRMHHKHCVQGPDDAACTRCLKKIVFFCLCSRDRLSEITLYRTGAGTVNARKHKVSRTIFEYLKSNASRITCEGPIVPIKLRQEFGEAVDLEVCPIIIADEVYREMPAEQQRLLAHRYQVADRSAAAVAANDFVRRSVNKCVEYYVSGKDDLTKLIFRGADRLAQENSGSSEPSFLTDVLRFWTAGRLIEGGWSFEGSQTLDLEAGATLVSAPAIDEQLAVILVDQVLCPLKKKVVKLLDGIITHKRKDRWLELTLAVFILLNHYHMSMVHQWNFSRSYGSSKRYTSKEFVTRLHAGARCLLLHYHVVCGGKKPFERTLTKADSEQKSSEQLKKKKIARWKEDKDDFVTELIDTIQERLAGFNHLANTEDYESEHWFTGQMFVPEWKPPDVPAHNELPVSA
ncbi:MAG: hypothetical protein Q9162_005845 [Coniocarpon cinnabarinum]